MSQADQSALPPTLAEALSDRFGRRFSTNAQILLQHGRSESHHELHLPDGVVMAHSTEEVAAVVGLCAEHRRPIIPFGAGTSIEGNTTPVRGGISLDLSEMSRILAVNPDDFDCTVEAGVRRQQL